MPQLLLLNLCDKMTVASVKLLCFEDWSQQGCESVVPKAPPVRRSEEKVLLTQSERVCFQCALDLASTCGTAPKALKNFTLLEWMIHLTIFGTVSNHPI